MSQIKPVSISYEIGLRWMPQNTVDDKSTLDQLKAWCLQAQACVAVWHYMLKNDKCASRSQFTRQASQSYIPYFRKNIGQTNIRCRRMDVITYSCPNPGAGLTTVYPKKYAHGFVVLCFVVVMQSFIMNSHEVFIHIHQGCFAGTGAIVRLPQCQ